MPFTPEQYQAFQINIDKGMDALTSDQAYQLLFHIQGKFISTLNHSQNAELLSAIEKSMPLGFWERFCWFFGHNIWGFGIGIVVIGIIAFVSLQNAREEEAIKGKEEAIKIKEQAERDHKNLIERTNQQIEHMLKEAQKYKEAAYIEIRHRQQYIEEKANKETHYFIEMKNLQAKQRDLIESVSKKNEYFKKIIGQTEGPMSHYAIKMAKKGLNI